MPPQRNERHYVFGYGSLICAQSRAVSVPTLAQRPSLPVRIGGLVRTWNCRCERPPSTFLGVKQLEDSNKDTKNTNVSCVGVLIEVFSDEFEALDEREYGYLRQLVHVDRIERVDGLLQTQEQKDQYEGTFLGTNAAVPEETFVWVYVPEDSFAGEPSARYPILQSYVDICMRGCLAISPSFLREFLCTTRGWHPMEILELQRPRSAAPIGQTDWNDKSHVGSWSDDRHAPIYVRADKEYSIQYAQHLDAHMEEAMLPLQQIRVRA
jgi:cation transport regulator ChaC